MRTFISNWRETYFSIKEKGLKRERITSLLLFLAVLLLFSLSFYDLLRNYEVNELKLSEDLYFGSTTFKALVYQVIILLGLFIRLISLRFNSRQSLRFSELGVFIAFFGWLGYLVWLAILQVEIPKYADVLYSSHLPALNGIAAILLSFSFIIWFFYKIIFLGYVTWKTLKK